LRTFSAEYITDDPHSSIPTRSSGWRNWCVPTAATTCRDPGRGHARHHRRGSAVTKVCNKYASRSSRFRPAGTTGRAMKDDEPTLQFDLRRMNRILDIDEKNRFAIVSLRDLRATAGGDDEARAEHQHHRAGSSTSVVASACAYFGGGPSSYAMGNNSTTCWAGVGDAGR